MRFYYLEQLAQRSKYVKARLLMILNRDLIKHWFHPPPAGRLSGQMTCFNPISDCHKLPYHKKMKQRPFHIIFDELHPIPPNNNENSKKPKQ